MSDSETLRAMTETGSGAECTVCWKRKAPRGRSVPLGVLLCDFECRGYALEPRPGELWPGETRADFGYPKELAERDRVLRVALAVLAREEAAAQALPLAFHVDRGRDGSPRAWLLIPATDMEGNPSLCEWGGGTMTAAEFVASLFATAREIAATAQALEAPVTLRTEAGE